MLLIHANSPIHYQSLLDDKIKAEISPSSSYIIKKKIRDFVMQINMNNKNKGREKTSCLAWQQVNNGPRKKSTRL